MHAGVRAQRALGLFAGRAFQIQPQHAMLRPHGRVTRGVLKGSGKRGAALIQPRQIAEKTGEVNTAKRVQKFVLRGW